ncbi:MAG: RDD family protein [Verrucomicrobiota bacterium]
MAKWYYTDSDVAQWGPIDGPSLVELNQIGEITARSLVWRDGMPEWVPFGTVAGELMNGEEGEENPEIGVCAYSGRVYPVGEMLPYGEALVGPDDKEAFVQQMMEQGAVDLVDATETHFEFIGFWWRCLSSLLDYLILMVPSWICMIPYYVVIFTQGADFQGDVNEPNLGFTLAMGISYGIGLLGILGVSIFYETWMVGKYQATLGKIVIGARVANPDGSRLSYKRAFVRWLAKKPLNNVIVWLPSTVGFALVIGLIVGLSENAEGSVTIVMAMLTGIFVYLALLGLCSAVYWMAAFDPEKRALHDRIVGTRVIKK